MDSPEERDRIALAYFKAEGKDQHPVCPRCGGELDISVDFKVLPEMGLRIECGECSESFRWMSERLPQDFKALHVAYFLECLEASRPLRCPYDDAGIVAREFSDGVREFRCPYCNRVGVAEDR